MISSIINGIVELLKSILGLVKTKQEVKQREEVKKEEEFKAKNTKEEKEKAQKIEDIKDKDAAEKLIADLKAAKTQKEKDEYLRKIRTQVGG